MLHSLQYFVIPCPPFLFSLLPFTLQKNNTTNQTRTTDRPKQAVFPVINIKAGIQCNLGGAQPPRKLFPCIIKLSIQTTAAFIAVLSYMYPRDESIKKHVSHLNNVQDRTEKKLASSLKCPKRAFLNISLGGQDNKPVFSTKSQTAPAEHKETSSVQLVNSKSKFMFKKLLMLFL